ncbi:MAG: hypothetical protein AAFY59_13685 [Pseudomonadota bacterium]
MTPLPIGGTLREAAEIFLRNGVWLVIEFAAAMVAVTTAYVVLFPGQATFLFSGGQVTNATFLFINPYSVLSSLIYTAVSTSALLRLWPRVTGQALPGPSAAGWLAILGTALAVDHVLTFSIFFFIVPVIIISALTCIILPLQVIERQGWQALGLSLRETSPHLLPLVGIWAALLLPWLILLFTAGPDRSEVADATLTDLWLRELAADLYAPLFIAFSLCLITAIYRRLRQPTPDSKDLDDIFR